MTEKKKIKMEKEWNGPSLVEVLELMNSGKLAGSGYDLSILSVIDPKTYDMANGQIFFENFTFIFTSTNEKDRDDIANDIKGWLAENTMNMFIHVDADEFREQLRQLAQKRVPYSQSGILLIEVLISYLSILLLNADHIYMQSYDISTDVGDFFWTYVGMQKLTSQQIKEKYEIKVDWLSENDNRKAKMSFMPIITKKEQKK